MIQQQRPGTATCRAHHSLGTCLLGQTRHPGIPVADARHHCRHLINCLLFTQWHHRSMRKRQTSNWYHQLHWSPLLLLHCRARCLFLSLSLPTTIASTRTCSGGWRQTWGFCWKRSRTHNISSWTFSKPWMALPVNEAILQLTQAVWHTPDTEEGVLCLLMGQIFSLHSHLPSSLTVSAAAEQAH